MEKYYEVLGVDSTTSLKDLKKKYIKLMRQTHPDKGYDEELCKKINEAYQKILEFKLNGFCEDNNLPLVPKKFQEMGFEKIPTAHEYVRELIKIQKINKLTENDNENEVLQLENVKKKSMLEKIFDFFFEDDSSDEED